MIDEELKALRDYIEPDDTDEDRPEIRRMLVAAADEIERLRAWSTVADMRRETIKRLEGEQEVLGEIVARHSKQRGELRAALREALEGWAGLLESDYPPGTMSVSEIAIHRLHRILEGGHVE